MATSNPPRNGEGDRAAQRRGGGGPKVLIEPIKIVRFARGLRKRMSPPEVLLRQELRKRPGGFRFRRQFPKAGYVLDFACLEARIGIEIDGEDHYHEDRPQRDERRDVRLETRGFSMFRIAANEVFRNLEGVLDGIVELCRARGPLHHPAPPGGPPPRSGEDR